MLCQYDLGCRDCAGRRSSARALGRPTGGSSSGDASRLRDATGWQPTVPVLSAPFGTLSSRSNRGWWPHHNERPGDEVGPPRPGAVAPQRVRCTSVRCQTSMPRPRMTLIQPIANARFTTANERANARTPRRKSPSADEQVSDPGGNDAKDDRDRHDKVTGLSTGSLQKPGDRGECQEPRSGPSQQLVGPVRGDPGRRHGGSRPAIVVDADAWVAVRVRLRSCSRSPLIGRSVATAPRENTTSPSFP